MIFSLAILFLLLLYGMRFGRSKAFGSHLAKERTNSVMGFFILVVFLSHIKQYILSASYEYHTLGDMAFRKFMLFTGQLMVVMFLFYSGYGVMESIKNKKEAYIKSIPRHRILNTLVNFDVAVCIFLLVSIIIGNRPTVPQFLLSLVAWDSMGNSNWYIFAILICYITTWLTASLFKSPAGIAISSFLILSVAAVALSSVKETYWYNTLWAYPSGMFLSVYRKETEELLDRHYLSALLILSLCFVAFFFIPSEMAGFRTNAQSIFFAMLTVTITMRVRIGNPVLQWCGENLFPLYIYQRIPMIILAVTLPAWMIAERPFIYIMMCLTVSVLICMGYRFINIKL